MRTLAGAFATSLVQTVWSDDTRASQTGLVENLTHGAKAVRDFEALGLSRPSAVGQLASLIDSQSVMLATLHVFGTITVVFFAAALLIWISPRPRGPVAVGGGH